MAGQTLRTLRRLPILKQVADYTHWLHGRWPAGKVEKLPAVRDDGSTNVPGLYVVGDLAGVPLLKLSVNSGVEVVRTIRADSRFQRRAQDEAVVDLAIIGGGAAGFAAAKEAKAQGLSYRLYESSQPFATVVNFPKGKPIFTYPTGMATEGELAFHDKSEVKEGLLEDLRDQTVDRGVEPVIAAVDHIERERGGTLRVVTEGGGESGGDHAEEGARAHRVIVAIGRSGNYRELGVPGEELDHKVFNRLHDPADYAGQNVLVVGGGDSAVETAAALVGAGANVTLSYRRAQLGRPKTENIEAVRALAEGGEQPPATGPSDPRQASSHGGGGGGGDGGGRLTLMMPSEVKRIGEDRVELVDQSADGQTRSIDNDAVFAMIGREAPLGFFRKSGVRIRGEWTAAAGVGLAVFLTFCFWLYHWKSYESLPFMHALPGWAALTPAHGVDWIVGSLGGAISGYFHHAGTLGNILMRSASERSFYYTLVYSTIVVVFGIARIRRRKTPYVTWQTCTLMAIQVIPLFILPEIVLPYMGAHGLFDHGFGAWFADLFFPKTQGGFGREYWRAYGFILAWPLMAWNWFTAQPLWGWLVLGFLQTFVAIPVMVFFWGKGAYCGWICSCGAMAETLGDTHRRKMPHGPAWNRVNMIGQVLLGFAGVIMGLRIAGWLGVGWASAGFDWTSGKLAVLNWGWLVDVMWAGVIGFGLYFWYSGRVWCRFACPLAALMHIYARFSRFRILAEKKKCISCNECTSVCHQGIDVMSFANKGQPMADPECVRCSACVQSCPTGVLSFGQVNSGGEVISRDPPWLAASPVRMAEVTVEGKRVKT